MHPDILSNARTETPGENVETIKFSKSAIRMFNEMRKRHDLEINYALQELYEEMGITERLSKVQETGEMARVDKKFTFIEFITPPKEKEDDKESGNKTDETT